MAVPKDNPPEVDELYGLEPVFEPGAAEATPEGCASLQLRTVQCPYCGEPFETMVDFSCGSTTYIEDCAICCRPIEFLLEVADGGTSARLQVGRSD
ncbi:MAG TPA: CPXCG motif-containing cysteine-rich protein [Steroidobacteraceae bacterium]